MRYSGSKLAMLLAVSCCSSASRYDLVSIDKYRDVRECWYRGSQNEALFVTAEDGQELIPYLISPFCNVRVDGYPPRSGFMAMLKAISLAGDQDELHKLGYVDRPLSSNGYVHIPVPTGDRILHKMKFDLMPHTGQGVPYYSIGRISAFCRTGVSLSKYQMMSDRDRAALANQDCH